MRRRGISMIEVVVLVALAACLMLPVLELSGRNAQDPQEMLERQAATALCMDACERLKTYSLSRPVPGEGGVPAKYLYEPAGAPFHPTVERTPDPSVPGLFRLDVTVTWTGAKGHPRSVRAARYCYAP